MKLSLETFFGRRYESKTKQEPKQPLNEKDRKHLLDNILKKCTSAYISRMTGSGLTNVLDSNADLVSEAYIAMVNIMDKFDKGKCGVIAEFDVQGETAPKTLEFYFYNYFCWRVNFMAEDTRQGKRKRGMIGPSSGSTDQTVYNPEDQAANPEYHHRFDSHRFLMAELKLQPQQIQDLFQDSYVDKMKTDELKKLYPDYLKLRRALGAFVKNFRSQHRELLSEEVEGFVKDEE